MQQPIIQQRVELDPPHLDAVLQSLQRVLDETSGIGAGLAELDVAAAQLRGAQQRPWQVDVAQRLELRDSQQPLGGAGMAGHEDRLAARRASGSICR